MTGSDVNYCINTSSFEVLRVDFCTQGAICVIFSKGSTSNKTGQFTGFLCRIVGDVSLSLLNVFLFSVITYVFQILIIKRKSIEHNLSCILCLWSFNGLYVIHLILSKEILNCFFAWLTFSPFSVLSISFNLNRSNNFTVFPCEGTS
jgi:hypothetical protein